MRRRGLVALALAGAALGGCADGDDASRVDGAPASGSSEQAREGRAGASPSALPPPRPYRPRAEEGYPNGKRLAAMIAQRATTYARGSTPRRVAERIGPSAVGVQALTTAIEPAVDSELQATGTVVYPQLSGVTPTTLGAMVTVRQTLAGADGERRSVTRVLDVRLSRSGGPWSLDQIGGVGGSPPAREAPASPVAEGVLDNPRITLTDSARWDIQRGDVDDGLLQALSDAAEEYRLGVGVIKSGHPVNVWATSTPSAHSIGAAADIYAVDGRPVIAQTQEGSAAFRLASGLVAGGAAQVGSPWVLGTGGSQSFADEVHQDHIHLQQTAGG